MAKYGRFKDKDTHKLFYGDYVPGVQENMRKKIFEKLSQVYFTTRIESLKIPPSNNLEQLKGDRKGQWSIRINDVMRVCFVWDKTASQAENIEFVKNYHKKG